jgi:hypothetical protein
LNDPVRAKERDRWRQELGDLAVVGSDAARPEIGIRCSTHFPLSDLQNLQGATLIARFLADKRLD